MIQKYWIIFLLTFVNGLSFTILFPLLPFLIKEYSQPEVVLWILLATYSFFQFIAAPILWSLSDKYGRKPLLLLTQFGTFLSWVVLWAAYFLPSQEILWFVVLPIIVIFFSRVLDWITGWNVSIANSVLADLSEKKDRSKIFGANAAVMGLALATWPSIGSLTLGFPGSYSVTALVGGIISLITLWVIYFFLKETLSKEQRNSELKISFKKLNIYSQLQKWAQFRNIRYVLVMKVFLFLTFVSYTSISALYLVDTFWFNETTVGYYLTFTGFFLIFHQALSIRLLVNRVWDNKSLIVGSLLMGLGFIWLALSWENIYVFTVVYFFTVLWISLFLTTSNGLISKSVEPQNQGEVMGMSSSIDSFISVLAPIWVSLLYSFVPFSIYYLISLPAFLAFLLYLLFYRDVRFSET